MTFSWNPVIPFGLRLHRLSLNLHLSTKHNTPKHKATAILPIAFLAMLCVMPGRAQGGPQLGAQIWIEPGQTPEQIDSWFATLQSSDMPVARIFVMWAYLEKTPDHWDFSLYDNVFRSAAKHHVRLVATLTPNGPPPFRGGNGDQGRDLLRSDKDRESAVVYLRKVVEHFRSSPALDTWLLVNEPGQLPAPSENAVRAFRRWAAEKYRLIESLNANWGTAYIQFEAVEPSMMERSWNHNRELDWRTFWEGYQSDELNWLAGQVRALDRMHPLHLNPAGISGNVADVSDNLPQWRQFLDTLGCSIHPAWHFALFDRDRYALGVSYTNDLVRGSIEPKPYWVTELQGGNNIYSGNVPMEPSAPDIAQWTWTSLGAGAQRVIFWLLNARREGVEAGEWSLLDFQQRPSLRLKTASGIAKIVQQQSPFFTRAKPEFSPVTILLSLETMTFEETYHQSDDLVRDRNAHTLEMLGFYEALSRMGPPPNIKYFDDYDWTSVTPRPRVAIIPDVREMSEKQMLSLKAFAEHGNTLLISGLSGFYGPYAKAWPLAGFPLAAVTGSTLQEVHLSQTTPAIALDGIPDALPSRFWVSSLSADGARAIGTQNGDVIATERLLPSGGRVVYIPSPIGLGAWLTDAQPLAQYLHDSILARIEQPAFSLQLPQTGCLMRTLKNGGTYVTVVTNARSSANHCVMQTPPNLHPAQLWGETPRADGSRVIFDMTPRATSVQIWR